MVQRQKGRYEQSYHKKQSVRKMLIMGMAMLLCVGLAVWVFWGGGNISKDDVYHAVANSGYKGTQEQLLASIVGEEAQGGTGKTAYQLACENGYQESEQVWLETLTGFQSKETGVSPYQLACENGYSGTFSQWLSSIASKQEQLGLSENTDSKTEYELACEYGYTGTFVEWLISVVYDQAF